ncbi:prolyl oligopeptidase family serine peptidase [Maribacter sp. 2210JD10-5]|uniref:S9 family peptidase n=1 Tax=Maribacter sp. 2210JD10-5 TaxID=3386272 RepID=UPI0039BCA465
MKNIFLFITAIFLMNFGTAQQSRNPTFEDVISLRSASNAVISPNGEHIVFTSQTADWENNRYDTELWISKNGQPPFQLTNNPKNNSSSPKWSPDGKWIAFLSNRLKKTQLHVIGSEGGESFQITDTENNISSFEWSHDGSKIAFLQAEDKSKEEKKKEDKYGGYAVEDGEYRMNQLWVINFNPGQLYNKSLPEQIKDSVTMQEKKAKLLVGSTKFSINNFKWSPDGGKIAFGHQPDPSRVAFLKEDISIYDVSSGSHKILINNPSTDNLVDWSPDGRTILYQTNLTDDTSNFYRNNKLFRINSDGSGNVQLAKDFDENLSQIKWNANGIFAIAWQKTKRPLVKIHPKNGSTSLLTSGLERIFSYSFSKDGKKVAFTGVNDTDLAEVYLANYPLKGNKSISNFTKQIKNWSVAKSEVISWKSEDGAIIEGVLHKPEDYDPNKKYPLLVIIHGGPTGISTPSATPSYVYPMIQWLNKGALLLRPNYRGSAGYGEKFRSLNVENLGVGDAWDVLSGVKYLEDMGIVDGDKVASMGWSQGGYISAFLTTNSDKFKAISVGAGISNWTTYYVSTDIHPFTRQYLKATPWSNKAIYEKTSPMTNINNASTPTLIQHGEFDRRVPTANAYELYQGLQDVGVETKLIIYKGFGHGIDKPRERLAATWHNWQWFGKYIWDETIEIPKE